MGKGRKGGKGGNFGRDADEGVQIMLRKKKKIILRQQKTREK